MGLGFKEAAKAGLSFGKDDIVIPARKKALVAETRALVEEYEQQYADGLVRGDPAGHPDDDVHRDRAATPRAA
jgi:DNA-directed RNA polymerase beta' subunit